MVNLPSLFPIHKNVKSTSVFLNPTNLKTSPPCIPYNRQETAEYLRAGKEQTLSAAKTSDPPKSKGGIKARAWQIKLSGLSRAQLSALI